MSTETVTTEPKKRGSVLYLLSEKGVITRQDTKIPGSKPEGIAALGEDGKTRWAHPDFVKYETQVKGLLKKEGKPVDIVPYEVRPPVMRDATLARDFSTDGDVKTPFDRGANPEVKHHFPEYFSEAPPVDDGPDGMRLLSVDQRKAVNLLRSKEGFPLGELERPAPPAPEKTSGAGDKAPEFVKWLLRYHPARFCEVYGVMRVGRIEVRQPDTIDPVSHVRVRGKRVWQDGHVIARRETIYTKVAGAQANDKEES